jgi:hypothetical protein
MTDRQLTPKEQKVVSAFEASRPDLGAVAEKNILNDATGWADSIASMDSEEIPDRAAVGRASSSHLYRHLGH